MNEKNNDSVLLESAMQTLRAIAGAATFRDQANDKMILASYAELARAELRLIESRKRAYIEELRNKCFGGLEDTDFSYDHKRDLDMQEGL